MHVLSFHILLAHKNIDFRKSIFIILPTHEINRFALLVLYVCMYHVA
jgi:hypothetical protein